MMQIRDFVNEPKLRDMLFADGRVWNMVCSSMDAVEDTDLAMEAYLKIIKESSTQDVPPTFDKGYSYLLCSGAMQTLFVQRDAVAKLSECLVISYHEDQYPELKEIREIRNASIGHPVDWRGKHSVHVIQHSLGISGFEMWVFSDDHSYEITTVSVPKLVADQRKCLADALRKIIDELRQRERQHRKKFRDMKLAEIISPNMHYFFEKIYEATRRRECAPTGIAALETLVGNIGKTEQALKDRGIERKTYDSIGYLYDVLEYPIGKLRAYYQSVQERHDSDIDNETAHIMAFFVCEHIKKLKELLQGIDDEYASEP
jgi:hypothetical protein